MFRSKQRILLAKEESTYGTDSSPSVSDNAIDAIDIKVNYNGDVLERDLNRASLSPNQALTGKRFVEVTFTCELKGSGSLGTAPAIGDLLEACGFGEVVSAGSSVTYTPASTGHKSVTLYVYDVQVESGNWRLHKITGARGTFNLVTEAGQIAKLEFTFRGLYAIPTDVSSPGSATYEATVPPVVCSSNFTLNSNSNLVVQSLNIDLANEVNEREDLNSSGCIAGFVIAGRKPAGTFNPEAVLLATYDFWGDWVGATEREMSIVVGSSSGNKITITAPKVTIDNIAQGDRNGILTHDIPFRLAMDSGDDELEIKFE